MYQPWQRLAKVKFCWGPPHGLAGGGNNIYTPPSRFCNNAWTEARGHHQECLCEGLQVYSFLFGWDKRWRALRTLDVAACTSVLPEDLWPVLLGHGRNVCLSCAKANKRQMSSVPALSNAMHVTALSNALYGTQKKFLMGVVHVVVNRQKGQSTTSQPRIEIHNKLPHTRSGRCPSERDESCMAV